MFTFLSFKRLVAIGVLVSLFSFSTTAANTKQAPEASAAELNAPFREIPELTRAFINAAPQDRSDGIPVGQLGVDGGNKDIILALANEISEGKHGRFDSMLLSQNGKLLFESYYLRGRINLPHPQASATKAHTAMALGRAMQLGYLTMADLDKPLMQFLPDLDPSKFAPGIETITLHKALTMRGGLRVNDEKWDAIKQSPEAVTGQKLIQALFEQSAPVTPDAQTFSYGNFNPDLVMQVIDALVPGSASDFIEKELLQKMGISNYRWVEAVNGLPSAGSRSSFNSRDMIKWGMLARDKGKWQGEQLIPKAYVEHAVSRQFLTVDEKLHYGGKDVSNQGYGYYWWSADLKQGNKHYFSVSAQGGYGQFIVLIADLDLMVVFTGHDNDTRYLQILAERILPAFVD